jgi:hypothetical protein
MPDLTISCEDASVMAVLIKILMGTHELSGCSDSEHDLLTMVENVDGVPAGKRMTSNLVSGETIELVLTDLSNGLVLVEPRLSQEEILKLKIGHQYQALCRLRGPKWNSDGVMTFIVDGSRHDWSPIELTITSEDWAEGMSEINEDGMIAYDCWYMEILSVPICLGEVEDDSRWPEDSTDQ